MQPIDRSRFFTGVQNDISGNFVLRHSLSTETKFNSRPMEIAFLELPTQPQ
jgi:hypothetical protein